MGIRDGTQTVRGVPHSGVVPGKQRVTPRRAKEKNPVRAAPVKG